MDNVFLFYQTQVVDEFLSISPKFRKQTESEQSTNAEND